MKMYLFIFIFGVCTSLPAQVKNEQSFDFWQTQIAEQNIQGKLQCILFAKDHFMYIGTSAGLFLYNGTKTTRVSFDTILQANITALYEDKQQTLWIGFQNGGIVRLQNKQLSVFQPEEGLPKTAISKILTDAEGRLWFATLGEGIYVQHNKKLYNINTDDGLGDNYIYDLELLPNNSIAASTDKGLSLCRYNGTKKTIENFSTGNGLPDNIIRCISQDRADKNIIWLGFQQGGICRFSLNTKQVTVFSVPAIKDKQVNDILVLDKQVWVTTENSFVQLHRNSTLISTQVFNNPTQLSVDEEANGWLICKTGLYKNAGEKLQLIVKTSDQALNEIHDMWQDEEDNTWYTTSSGIIKQEANSAVKTIIHLPGLDNKTDITCLYQDANQNLWIGTMGNGIYLLHTKTNAVTHLNNLPGNESMSILSITGRNSNIWISSLQGIFHTTINTSRAFQNLTELSGIGINYIYHIYEDSKGRVWFATDGKGLAMMQNNRFTHFSEKEGLTGKVIYSIAEDKKGVIWCAALQKGLFQFNGKTFTNFGTGKGIPDLDISSLDTDNKGNLFCISRSGYFLIDAETQAVIIPGNEKQLGIFNTDLNSTDHTKEGVVFHTSSGIFRYVSPSYQQMNQPQTAITSVSLFLKEINKEVEHQFKHDENNLSFSFSGIYFSDPALVQYQYKLEGYNNEWQGSRNDEVNFPKLQPASYTFRVRSSTTGNFDHASEAVYTFTISKPFWKQWWFIILSILSFTGFLVYIIKEREKTVKRWQLLQTEKLKSQYETLKNQVNPHFLFNSFNTLLSIIEEDPKKAETYVEHLSDFYRRIVNMREKDLISLGDELNIIDDYFFIQKKRFGNALLFDNRITEEEKTIYSIPPLALQLLAENAVKHNIVSKDKPLTLELFVEQEMLIVQNNINEKATKEKSEGLGLQNIKNRFLLIADKEVKIETTTTRFIVKLPLIKRS